VVVVVVVLLYLLPTSVLLKLMGFYWLEASSMKTRFNPFIMPSKP